MMGGGMWGFQGRHLKWLRKELPGWIDQGWVTADNAKAIDDHITARVEGTSYAPLAFAILGAIMMGAGVILYVASNWEGMGKLVRMIVLFGGMWSVYAVAGLSMHAQHSLSARFVDAFMLLGLLLFGANIWLIAQTYHISAHNPNGVLMWALGALAVVYLVPGQAAAVAGIALTVLWSIMEYSGYHHAYTHWPFLLLWAAFAVLSVRQGWHAAVKTACIALLIWEIDTLAHWPWSSRPSILAAIFILVSILQIEFGLLMRRTTWGEPFSGMMQRFGLLCGLSGLYVCSLSIMHGAGLGMGYFDGLKKVDGALPEMAALTVLLMGVAIAGLAWLKITARSDPAGIIYMPGLRGSSWDGYVFASLGGVFLANLFIPLEPFYARLIYTLFMMLNFLVVTWVIHGGYLAGDRLTVNLGFAFFALAVVTVYFDQVSSLLDRSLLFVLSGAVLIGGGYVLEVQRRTMMRAIAAARSEGVRP